MLCLHNWAGSGFANHHCPATVQPPQNTGKEILRSTVCHSTPKRAQIQTLPAQETIVTALVQLDFQSNTQADLIFAIVR